MAKNAVETNASAEKTQTVEAEVKATETKVETPATVENSGKKKNPESSYTAKELADNAKTLFNTRPECVAAALKVANITTATVSEAKDIVANFLKKEVK